MSVSEIEKAYGLLWRCISKDRRVLDARKLLLATLDKEGQRRGIQWAVDHVGPVTTAEILELDI